MAIGAAPGADPIGHGRVHHVHLGICAAWRNRPPSAAEGALVPAPIPAAEVAENVQRDIVLDLAFRELWMRSMPSASLRCSFGRFQVTDVGLELLVAGAVGQAFVDLDDVLAAAFDSGGS